MLKHSFDSQESIAENLRGAYVQSGNKWVLDTLSDDHPVLVKNSELLSEKTEREKKITRLTSEKQSLEANVLPAGHTAVPTADAQLAEKYKALGTPAEIESKLQEHDTLKQKIESREKADALRAIAIEYGYDADKIAALEDRFPAPTFKEVEVDGKKQQRAIFKSAIDGKESERTFIEHLESDPKLKPLQDSLKAAQTNGVRYHGSTSGGGATTKTVFDKVRDDVKKKEKAAVTELNPMFSKIPGRVAAPAGE